MHDCIPYKPEEIRRAKEAAKARRQWEFIRQFGGCTLFDGLKKPDDPSEHEVHDPTVGYAVTSPRLKASSVDRSSGPRKRSRSKKEAGVRERCSTSAYSKWPGQLRSPSCTASGRLRRYRAYRSLIERAPQDQKRINFIYFGDEFPRKLGTGKPLPLPGLIDQVECSRQRRWRSKQARKLRGNLRRKLEADPALSKGLTRHTYAVTLLRKEWIRPSLEPKILLIIRRQVQRQAKRLGELAVITGVIDVCPIRDEVSGTKGWGFHVHLTIQIAVEDAKAGRRAIRKAFPNKAAPAHGVYRGRHVKKCYDPSGWDHYQDKLFQLDGVRQWVVRPNPKTGKRLKAHKPPLTVAQQEQLVKFMAAVRADELMIWVRHRRYGDRVLPIACNPPKSKNA